MNREKKKNKRRGKKTERFDTDPSVDGESVSPLSLFFSFVLLHLFPAVGHFQ